MKLHITEYQNLCDIIICSPLAIKSDYIVLFGRHGMSWHISQNSIMLALELH